MRPFARLALGFLLGGSLFGQTPAAPDPHFLHRSLGERPYFQHKYGFASVLEAKNHAYKEYLRLVKQGRIDPREREFFSYIYTIKHADSGRIIYFHSEWEPAAYVRTEQGMEQYEIRSPIAESATIRKNSLIHSHPTQAVNGEGPSRLDVAVASSYRKGNGKFRYLYLVNNHLRLIQFKARRSIDPGNRAALLGLPLKPRQGLDWMN